MMCEWNYWPVQGPSHGHYYQQHPQPQPQVDLRAYGGYYDYPAYNNNASSSRQQRNQAEKQRRDKLNQFINELALLVPMVSTSAKKLDKTSILRLSATFLRMHRILVGTPKGQKVKDLGIPMEWCQQLLDGMEGMLLVVSSSGKIVFVSYNVESILGHHQNDLLGEYLREFTHPDDRDELMRNLKFSDSPDESLMNIGEDSRRPERRSFFLRMKQRPASRSDQPQYEVLHFEGHLRTPRQQISVHNKNRAEGAINTNETVLVALVRPYKERNVTDNSLLEATKEEWVTRHLIDGTIIFSDHRISFLSGYLAEEVTGSPAFKYMHPDDVRWVMIALRQMYCKSESYGWSCYRLQSKNGEYIYLRTHGVLENDEQDNVQSFICINTLVTQQEGEKCIAELKRMFTPMVGKRSEPLIASVVDNKTNKNVDPCTSEDVVPPLQVEDNEELELAIELLLSDLPPIGVRHKTSHPYTMKANTLSKTLPSVEVQRRQVGAKLPVVQVKYSRPSVITSVSANGDRQKRSQESLEEAEVKRLRGNRSVIVSDTRSHIDTYAVDNNFIFNTDLLLDTPSSSFSQFPENSTENSTYLHENISNQLLDFLTNGTEDDDALRIPVEVTSSDIWDTPVSDLEEGVLRGHMHLENRIQSQGVQIQEIEEDLQTVPLTGSHVYQNHFTHLKAEHRKQQELLKTLQQDHHRQQTKEQISIRGTEQNIGV